MLRPNRFIPLALLVTALFLSAAAEAATFVVPDDRDLVQRADAIVIATPVISFGQFTRDGGIETVTKMSVEEVIKGTASSDALDVFEPGGVVGNVASMVAGSPRFESGQRLLLFLKKTGAGRWSVADLVLGKFSFTKDGAGHPLLTRDADEIVGWDPDLKAHRERTRDAETFLQFVRSIAASKPATENYFLESTEKPATRSGRSFSAVTNIAPFTATSYTMTISGSQGSRWNVFPSGVTFFASASGEPGAPGNGTTAVQAAINAWDNDPNSNVNYVYGGTDSTHTQGLHAADGANTVLFERDLSSWGVTPFQCTSNSYSGTLGIGGITSASGTNTLGSETFVTTKEGDVEMNRGLANCTLLFNNGDFNSAVAHEIGHTLGFRHSDQTRDSGSACTNDPSLECSNNAIMKSFVSQGLNATLQAWDQHAVDAVYPGSSSTCTPPAITTQPASKTITAGQSTTLSVVASGTTPLSYQWYVGASGNTTSPVTGGTGSFINVTPASTTSYWVRVSNACGSANSSTATVTVTAATGGSVRGDFNGDGVPDLIWRNFATGENRIWFMSTNGSVISSVAILSAPDLNWVIGGAGDFNGDGKQDIVWRNQATGQDLVWLMNGTTYVSTLSLTTVPDTNWRIESVNDFNGDGKPDLLWRHYGIGMNVIWYMNGATLLSSVTLTSAPDLAWRMVGSGNLNGDGAQDIVWRNSTNGEALVWFMSGANSATLASSAAIWPSMSADIQIDAVSSYNGDSISDIVLRNYTTGQDVAWIMSPSGTISTTLSFPAETNLNWHIVGPQ